MRILLASEGIDEAGGVETYVTAVARGLRSRGHAVARLHHNRSAGPPPADAAAFPRFGVEELGLDGAIDAAAAWRPDVCFSHNMAALDVDRALVGRWRVVKMMHGYFGTCVSGQKSFEVPRREPCDRRFGAACLALYLPRRCGQLRPAVMMRQYGWALAQRRLFDEYAALVLASEHMRREYERNGAPAAKLRVVPLFAPAACSACEPDASASSAYSAARIVFLGRMTRLKGGDVLIDAVAQLGRRVDLIMAGDGPERAAWQRLAERLGVAAAFPGWIDAAARDALLRSATLVALPSVWPEPFGLTGLEAGARGVPAVAFDVGGIREWLTDGDNGVLARGSPPTASSLAAAIAAALEPATLGRLQTGARRVASEMSLARHLDRLEPVLAAAASL